MSYEHLSEAVKQGIADAMEGTDGYPEAGIAQQHGVLIEEVWVICAEFEVVRCIECCVWVAMAETTIVDEAIVCADCCKE